MIEKTLSELIAALPDARLSGPLPQAGAPVQAIVLDSRKVQPGSIFVALAGGSVDGHRFIPDAVARGAVAVVGSQPITGLSVPYIMTVDGRAALARLSAALYDFPARRLTVLGVTGTDGKTTTSTLIYHILRAAGLQAGMVSTVSARIAGQEQDTGFHVTTPEAPDVQRYLRAMLDAGQTHVVLEATSHGLHQQRVAESEFDVAVVTNITHEHLDYHGTYEAYRQAKGRLFTSLAETAKKAFGNPRLAVLNRDDSSYEYLRSLATAPEAVQAGVRNVSYGVSAQAQVRASQVQTSASGLHFEVCGPDFSLAVDTPLHGLYNVSNCLAAISACVIGLGISPEAARQGLAAVQPVPGRMERIDLGMDFLAYVDFAHTPYALRAALETARHIQESQGRNGRVIAVFGSAGLRDRLKRRMMAETAAELADLIVLTAEDPRTESLEAILEEMAAGARSRGGVEGRSFWRIPDRGEALRFAVRLAKPGDILLALGKGHEQSMCFGEIEYPWDDRTALRAALSEYLGIPGPPMPRLPTSQV